MQNEVQLLYEKIKYELSECYKDALDHLKTGRGITTISDYKFIQARLITLEETMEMMRKAYAKAISTAIGEDDESTT